MSLGHSADGGSARWRLRHDTRLIDIRDLQWLQSVPSPCLLKICRQPAMALSCAKALAPKTCKFASLLEWPCQPSGGLQVGVGLLRRDAQGKPALRPRRESPAGGFAGLGW